MKWLPHEIRLRLAEWKNRPTWHEVSYGVSQQKTILWWKTVPLMKAGGPGASPTWHSLGSSKQGAARAWRARREHNPVTVDVTEVRRWQQPGLSSGSWCLMWMKLEDYLRLIHPSSCFLFTAPGFRTTAMPGGPGIFPTSSALENHMSGPNIAYHSLSARGK